MDSTDKKECKRERELATQRGVVLFIMFALLVWAVFLAMKVQDKDHKTLHLFLALIASPIYILSHYAASI